MSNLNSREMPKKKCSGEYHDSIKGTNNFIVYLNDDEFQIQLVNPTSRVIGAKFKFSNERKGCFLNDKHSVEHTRLDCSALVMTSLFSILMKFLTRLR